jgi:hypothetical protein
MKLHDPTHCSPPGSPCLETEPLILLTSILILSYHLHLSLLSSLVPLGLRMKILYFCSFLRVSFAWYSYTLQWTISVLWCKKVPRSHQSKNPKIGSVEWKVNWLPLRKFLGCNCAVRPPDGGVTNVSSKIRYMNFGFCLYVFWEHQKGDSFHFVHHKSHTGWCGMEPSPWRWDVSSYPPEPW